MSNISNPDIPVNDPSIPVIDITIHEEPTVFHDAEVVDEHGDHIGKVADVIYDEDSDTPQWLAVDLGLLSAEHYVPVHNSYKSEDGRVVVAYDKATVKHAPRAHRDHIITTEVKAQLRRHYSLN